MKKGLVQKFMDESLSHPLSHNGSLDLAKEAREFSVNKDDLKRYEH